MTRNSKFSQQNYLAATSLNPKKPSRGLSLQEQIMETKLRSDQAKLAALEAELPSPDAKKYMRYEDMPPPSPQQEAEFDREFRALLDDLLAEPWGPEKDQSVQDWLTELGANIPDTPEWKTPLYLDKFVSAGAGTLT